jgi:hypothetical protein
MILPGVDAIPLRGPARIIHVDRSRLFEVGGSSGNLLFFDFLPFSLSLLSLLSSSQAGETPNFLDRNLGYFSLE